jgi:hypothetical protein
MTVIEINEYRSNGINFHAKNYDMNFRSSLIISETCKLPITTDGSIQEFLTSF